MRTMWSMPVIRTGGLSRRKSHDEAPCTRAVGAGRGATALREQGSSAQDLCVRVARSLRRAGPGAADPLAGPTGGRGPSDRPIGGRGQAVGWHGRRSCTFFLQTAISKWQDHADSPIGPDPGGRMNVQRGRRCTFILFPDVPEGGKPLEPRHHPNQHPGKNVQHHPAPDPRTNSRHRPGHPLSHSAGSPGGPRPPHHQQPPDPRNQAPPRPRCTAHSGTFCAEGNRLRTKRPRFVTFCTKRYPTHKTSPCAQNVPAHHFHHDRSAGGSLRRTLPRQVRLRIRCPSSGRWA